MRYTAKQREAKMLQVAQGVDLDDDNVIFDIKLRQADIMCQTTNEYKGKATWLHRDSHTRVKVNSKFGNSWKATIQNDADFNTNAEKAWIDLVDKLENDFNE